MKVLNDIKDLKNNKLNKADVVNTTTQVEADEKALNAVQANPLVPNSLANQIKTVKENGFNGMLTSDTIQPTDMNSFISKCYYDVVWDTTSILNFPPVLKGVTRLKIKVEIFAGEMCRQEIEFQAGAISGGTWYRSLIDGVWQGWEQIATTTRVPFTCTAKIGSGCTLSNQVCYTKNGEFHISLMVAKTDLTTFAQGVRVEPMSIPFATNGISIASAMGRIGTEWTGNVNAFCSGSQFYIIPISANIDNVYITVRGGIV